MVREGAGGAGTCRAVAFAAAAPEPGRVGGVRGFGRLTRGRAGRWRSRRRRRSRVGSEASGGS